MGGRNSPLHPLFSTQHKNYKNLKINTILIIINKYNKLGQPHNKGNIT
tara:strand:+ start:467 stop:610 length:144 start_codon:yes stop_codon:yes gene_type:complete